MGMLVAIRRPTHRGGGSRRRPRNRCGGGEWQRRRPTHRIDGGCIGERGIAATVTNTSYRRWTYPNPTQNPQNSSILLKRILFFGGFMRNGRARWRWSPFGYWRMERIVFFVWFCCRIGASGASSVPEVSDYGRVMDINVSDVDEVIEVDVKMWILMWVMWILSCGVFELP